MVGGLNNILAVVTGVSMITACSLTFYIFQKKLFTKYRDNVRNVMDKATSEPPTIPNKKV